MAEENEVINEWKRSVVVDEVNEEHMDKLLMVVNTKSQENLESHVKDAVNNRILLRFNDANVAKMFLDMKTITMAGNVFKISQPSLVIDSCSSLPDTSFMVVDRPDEVKVNADDQDDEGHFHLVSSDFDQQGREQEDPGVEVFIDNIPEGLTESNLISLLDFSEIADRSEVKDVKFTEGRGGAKVIVKDRQTAVKIAGHSIIKYKGKELHISQNQQIRENEEEEEEKERIFDMIKVISDNDIESNDEEMLTLYFESETRSGGGSIVSLQKKINKKVIIKFADPAVAARVYQKKDHILINSHLTIIPLEKNNFDEMKSCAIEISGIKEKGHSEDFFKYFFERTENGGAKVEDVVLDSLKGVAVITFKTSQDVDRVLENHSRYLEKAPDSSIRRLEPLPPPPLVLDKAEERRLLVAGLPPRTNVEDLQNYFGRILGCRLLSWSPTIKKTKFLLEFAVKPDYKELKALVNSKPFRGKMISIRKVALTTSLKVSGVTDSMTDELLTLFFENPENGSGKVVEIKRDQENSLTYVKFENADVIPELAAKVLTLNGRRLTARPYYSFVLHQSFSAKPSTAAFRSLQQFNNSSLKRDFMSGRMYSSPQPNITPISEEISDKRSNNSSSGWSDLQLVEDQSSMSSEKMINLRQHQFELLTLSDIPKHVMNEMRGVEIKVTQRDAVVTGSKDLIASAKCMVLEKMMDVVTEKVDLPDISKRLLKKESIHDYIFQFCQMKQIKATTSLTDTGIELCGLDKSEVGKLQSILPSLVKELKFVSDLKEAVISEELIQQLKKIVPEVEIVVDSAEKVLIIGCLEKDETQVRKFVEDFLAIKAWTETTFSLSRRRIEFIQLYRTEELQKLKMKLEERGGCLTLFREEFPDEILLKGTRDEVKYVEEHLKVLDKGILEKKDTIVQPGVEKHLKGQIGSYILKGIQSDCNVLVDIKVKRMLLNQEPTRHSGAEASTAATIKTKEGLQITLVHGRIETQQVDVIVNTTSNNLRLDQGEVSKCILKAAGDTIQKECKEKGQINFGEIVYSKGYNLKCNRVIHGAAVKWDGPTGKALPTLKKLVCGCLTMAHDAKFTSIAFPAVGTGTLLMPADVVAKAMFEEVETFSRKHPTTSLANIRFVVFTENKKVCDAFASHLDSLKSPGGLWRAFNRRPLKPNKHETDLTILASSTDSADRALEAIKQAIQEATNEAVFVFDSPDVSRLTDDKICEIEELQREHSVRISFEPDETSNKIIIKGLHNDVTQAETRIRQKLYSVQ